MIWRSILFLLPIKTESLINYGREGDACNRNDINWYAVPQSKHHFIYCHPKHGVYVRDQCAIVNGQRKIFDPEMQMCILPSDSQPIYHPLSSLAKCQTSSQCTDDRWYCSRKGRCECKLDHVQIGAQCWKKIPVGSHVECVFDKQCAIVWPTARCIKRKCSCVPPQIPVSTYHGTVCTLPDSCPMGTQNSVLYHTQNCHLRGGCGENVQLSHFFDCIAFTQISSMCCPNKAYTCMQPKMPGNGPQRLMRYYYDAPTDQCRPFMFRGGNMVNTNVFQSKADCEVYCRSDCPIGLAEKNPSDGILYCDKDGDCGQFYSCHKKDVADRGICCPSPNWICSPEGGRDYSNEKPRLEEYDVGAAPKHVISVFYPVIRYYYSVNEYRCKAFMYQGEGGNFNQFETLEHCQQYCSPVSCGGDKALILEEKVVTCSTEEPCIDGYDCRHGLCCPRQAEFCLEYYEVFMEVDDEGNQRGRPLQCKHDADCPVPYVCQLTNQLSRTSLRGYCCRAIERPTTLTSTTVTKFIKTTPDFDNRLDENKISSTKTTPMTSTEIPTSTAETTSIATLAHTLSSKSTKEIILNVTAKSLPMMLICPSGRLPLIDKNGRSIVCEISEDPSQVSTNGCGGSGEHQCAFLSLNVTKGVCCQKLAYENNRCPGGMRPLLDIDSRQVRQCSPLNSDSCEGDGDGSVCVFDELYGDYHCCHPLSMLPVIPIVETTKTTFSPTTSTTLSTTTTTTTTSSTSTTTTSLIRVTPSPVPEPEENGEGCPIGQDPFEDPLMNKTKLECDPTVVGTCPPGFTCYESRTKETYLCCGVTSACSQNSAAFVSPITKSPVQCTQFTGCPPAYFCYKPPSRESINEGTCCSEDPVASLCDHGTALQDSHGKAIKCANDHCPRGYNCLTRFNISISCPTNENVCTQPLHKGLPCEEAPPISAYYFDVQSKACQEFSYSGCSGNDNRFETMSSCQNFCKLAAVCSVGMPLVQLNGELATCNEELSCLAGYQCVFTVEGNYCCPKPEMTCSLPRDQGTECGPSDNIHSKSTALFWYFSPADSACVPFEFRGCGGNFNRFITQQHCSMSCLHALCPIGSPKMDQGKLVKCSLEDQCPTGYLCTIPKFGAPNINICCPRPEMLCTAPEEKETHCSLAHYRYRYDTVQERCVKFVQSGCAGTTNSFSILSECEKICLTDDSVCAKGSELYVMPDTQRAMSCSPIETSCPPGYRCHANFDSLIHFCCSEPRCPSGKMPLLAKNGSAVSCNVEPFGFFDGCPSDYSCQQTSSGKFMCCPRAKPEEACPYPSRPFIHSDDKMPTVCSEKYGTCPFGYVCHHNRGFRENFCCSDLTISSRPDSSEINKVENPYLKDSCNDGSEPYKDEFTVRLCNPHLKFSCPEEYECQFNGAVSRYHCCKVEAITANLLEPMFDAKIACPAGLSVKLHPKTKQPIVCKPDVPEYCPLYSRCEYSSIYWQFICCTSAGVEEFYEEDVHTRTTQIGYYPGQAGCLADAQCQSTYPTSYCHDWICRCPENMKILDKTCVDKCPDGFDDHDGICGRLYRTQISHA